MKLEDLILGMNWMWKFGAVISLRTRTVHLLAEDGSEHQVWGIDPKRNGAQISAVRAARLLDQGCVGYWCYAIGVEGKAVGVAEIPVVREFADVFPEDLSGLPP